MGTTLQISLAPPDAPYAAAILPHQLRIWGDQVDEVLLSLDLRRPKGKQFAANWEVRRHEITDILANICDEWPSASVMEVDYSHEARSEIGRVFFGRTPVPPKDFRGGPYYSYLFGFHAATEDYVFHLDSDMLFGGGSKQWLTEAVDTLRANEDVMFVNPLPGPPGLDGRIDEGLRYEHVRIGPSTYRYSHVSTRLFLAYRPRFIQELCPLQADRQPGRAVRLSALLPGHNRYAPPEDVITRRMRQLGVSRIDMLGEAPGAWSLHPVVKDAQFCSSVERLVERVETDNITSDQIGRYNLVSSMLN